MVYGCAFGLDESPNQLNQPNLYRQVGSDSLLVSVSKPFFPKSFQANLDGSEASESAGKGEGGTEASYLSPPIPGLPGKEWEMSQPIPTMQDVL